MKAYKSALCLFPLILCCLLYMAAPVLAAESEAEAAGSFGITITLEYSDSDLNPHPLELYQQNAFLLEDSSGRFAQAEYSAAEEAYLVTGSVTDETADVRFHCGLCPDRPGALALLDLPDGVGREKRMLRDPLDEL